MCQFTNLTGLIDVDRVILVNLPLRDLYSVCTSSSYLNSCQDEYFWKLKLYHDCNENVEKDKPIDMSYRDWYKILATFVSHSGGANSAAKGGYLIVLKWLAEHNIYPSKNGANYAAKGGYLKVLKWLAGHNIYPSKLGAVLAARYGHLKVLQSPSIAGQNIYPDECGAYWAARNGHLPVLKWLAGYNIYPGKNGAYWASRNGHVKVVKWLASHGIYRMP
jgi:ankyrin repeat protein